jgi:NTP pyrophosphatase (non-canonical NTP hydrolase)
VRQRTRETDNRPSAGHLLYKEMLRKWKKDRFPTITLQVLQAGAETGELQGAWAKALDRAGRAVRGSEVLEEARHDPAVRKELGDAGLALYGVADKLGIDLIDAMAEVVEKETRRATE